VGDHRCLRRNDEQKTQRCRAHSRVFYAAYTPRWLTRQHSNLGNRNHPFLYLHRIEKNQKNQKSARSRCSAARTRPTLEYARKFSRSSRNRRRVYQCILGRRGGLFGLVVVVGCGEVGVVRRPDHEKSLALEWARVATNLLHIKRDSNTMEISVSLCIYPLHGPLWTICCTCAKQPEAHPHWLLPINLSAAMRRLANKRAPLLQQVTNRPKWTL
jgi:hypothetical protein